MRVGIFKNFLITAACLVGLAGCVTASKFGETPLADDSQSTASVPDATPDTTGTVPSPTGPAGAAPEVLGADPNDDLGLAKKYFRQGGFGLAERHYRKAVELHPRDAEAWVGLAASYDRLRRFDFADRAYRQAIKLIGPTPEILNNQGYSYILRGNYRLARATLLAARTKDPNSPFIKNNLDLLEETRRNAKAVN
jgi:tetratricopeptide (TPR) repeat protein